MQPLDGIWLFFNASVTTNVEVLMKPPAEKTVLFSPSVTFTSISYEQFMIVQQTLLMSSS